MVQPATTAERRITAWFVSVPYHGIRPRSSRTSVVPISATQAAAVGPPSVAAAIRGAIDTATIVPRGIRTGRADASERRDDPEGDADWNCRIANPLERLPDQRIDGNHKGRDQQRNRADCHDPNDVELELSRHATSVPELRRTLARSAHSGEHDLSTEAVFLDQKPFNDAPPASAIAATAATPVRTRTRRSFIGRSSGS